MDCGKGLILRKSYVRKSSKKGSKRASVKASCVKDRGMPGKGPKTLPPMDHKLSLKEFGYSTKSSQRVRRSSLKKASRANGTLPVLRHLNLIGNYSKSSENYPTIRDDVEYLKKQYAQEKKASIKHASKQTGGCGCQKSTPRTEQKGGSKRKGGCKKKKYNL